MFGIPEEVEEGQLLQVSCTITKGDEPLTLQWFMNGVPIVSSQKFAINNIGSRMSLLVLNGVGAEHSGTYSCVAFNQVGEARVDSNLRVKGRRFWT